MYRMKDGFMQNLHSNMFEDPTADIQDFRQDKRHRKCYVMSNKGEIKVLNISNGVALKTLVPQQIKSVVESDSSSEGDRGGSGEDIETQKRTVRYGNKKQVDVRKEEKAPAPVKKKKEMMMVMTKSGVERPVRKAQEITDFQLIWDEDV